MIHVDEGNLRNRFAFSIILFVRLKVNFYICVIAWNMEYEMGKRLRIVYCIPSVYKMGGMERVLALKVNFFVETFGYEVHIITTEGISGTPFFNFHPFVQIHDLNIHFDVWMPKYKRFLMYAYKRFLYNLNSATL